MSNLPALSPAHSWPSIDEIKKRRPETVSGAQATATRAAHQQITRKISRGGRRSNTRLALVLALAAALGCAVGYWAYLRLPPAIVPLTVHPHPPALTISWPSDQTREAEYAAIRVDDGEPLSLSEQDKAAGQTEINTTGDNVKVELIVRHWMRDSRGIIRFVTPLKPTPPPSPVTPEPAKRGSRRLPRPSHE